MKTINYKQNKYISEGITYFLLTFYYKDFIFSHKYALKGYEDKDKINIVLYKRRIFSKNLEIVYNKSYYGKLDMSIMINELSDWFKYEVGIKNIVLVKDGYKPWKDLSIGDTVSITDSYMPWKDLSVSDDASVADKPSDIPEENCIYTIKATTTSLNNGGSKWFQCENSLGDEYAFTVYNTDLFETVFYGTSKLIESKTEK